MREISMINSEQLISDKSNINQNMDGALKKSSNTKDLSLPNELKSDIPSMQLRSVIYMLDTTPLGCVIWNNSHRVIYCNEAALILFEFNNKEEFLKKFIICSPKYQPNGKCSREKALIMMKTAFDDGTCAFEWMYQTLNGTSIPAEVTYVRIKLNDDYAIVSYIKDLRMNKIIKENILQLETKASQIYYDPVTGIYNRRYLDENINSIMKILSRADGILSIMMIDIDNFKQYNDTYGHIEGDNCLKIIANVLKNSIARSEDFVARYGGEEFIIVLPNTGEVGACLIASKLIDDVRNCNIANNKNDKNRYVTISIGVITGKVRHTHCANDFIQQADNMLYKSKRNGRNSYNSAVLCPCEI